MRTEASRAGLADAPIACHEIDLAGVIVFVNQAECQLLGLPPEEILGRHAWNFVAPEEREKSRAAVHRKLSGEQPLKVFERPFVRPDGERLVLEIHEIHVRDEGGSLSGIRTFLHDITQRRRAEQAVRDSEARFRHLIENASDIIYRADLQGRFQFFNPTATRLLGYEPIELQGRKYLDLIREDYRLQAQTFYRKQLARRIPRTYFEFPVIAKNGAEIWFGQTVALVEENGRIVGVEAVTRDITDQRAADARQERARQELEARVRERTGELELAVQFLQREMEERRHAEEERLRLETQMRHAQRLESLGVLAGGIAHDFNNLLASMLGYASLALNDLPADAPARRSIQCVVDAATNAAELTRQMLAYSGKGQFLLEQVDLSRVAEETTRLVGTLTSKKAVLQLQLAAGLPAVEADVSQLRQIIVNLVTNASDALGENSGTIRMSTGSVEVEPGTLHGTDPGSTLPGGVYVFLEVSDTGCGMDTETRERIFDPFFSTKFTGRGLGLAAVLGIVRGHRGAIEVESELGAGTRFRVLFPASGVPAVVKEPAPAAAEWRGQGLVLVVDDEQSVRNLAAVILERSGFETIRAADGIEAVERFREHQQDICAVLLDMTMPGIDGAEVFRRITRLRPDVRVVVCSGYNVQDFEDFGGGTPAGFLRKPFAPGDLLARMRAALGD